MRIAAPLPVVCLVLVAAGAGSLSAVCTPSPTCMLSRFTVDLSWIDSPGVTQGAHGESFPAPVSANDSGYFWFTDPRYVEVYFRVLDRCISGRYWVLVASLTDVEYTLTVTDTESPATVSYTNPAGERTVVTDTDALDVCPPSTVTAGRPPPWAELGLASFTWELSSLESGFGKGALVPCTPDATTLCLVGDRYQVRMNWQTASQSGDGQALAVTSHSGTFGLVTTHEPDVAVKIVEACAAFEYHLAGFSTAEYTVEITDARRGALWSYTHLRGPAGATVAVVPRACLFGDGFESSGVGEWSTAIGSLP